MKKILYFLPAFTIMLIIFLASNDAASGEKSDFITKFIWNTIDNLFNYSHTYPQEIGTSYLIRKLAHMTEYGILCFSFYYGFINSFNYKFEKNIILSASLSLIYAISDEYHQSFIPGRVGTYQDVLIDFSGILLTILILKIKVSNRQT